MCHIAEIRVQSCGTIGMYLVTTMSKLYLVILQYSAYINTYINILLYIGGGIPNTPALTKGPPKGSAPCLSHSLDEKLHSPAEYYSTSCVFERPPPPTSQPIKEMHVNNSTNESRPTPQS